MRPHHLPFTLLSPLLLVTTATSTTLYATHYSGTLNTLSFTPSTSTSTLTLSNSTRTGTTLPSWITYDSVSKSLYIGDENFYSSQGGSLVAYQIGTGTSGGVKEIGRVGTAVGVVATALYGGEGNGKGRGFIVNAHYQTSQISTFALPLTAGAQPLQTLKYSMSGPGKIPSRQEAPHPHHAFTDPTGAYLIVPDLGADRIRIHRIDATSGRLTECGAGIPVPGTGPRHGAFWGNGTLFIANELSNSVSGWKVSYPTSSSGCMSLSLLNTLTPYAGNASAPQGTKVAEVRVKDNFLYSTNRNDKKFSGNDSITQYIIAADGRLSWTELTSSYGTYPRTFDINKAGDYVAVGDQTTSNVAVVARDRTTGRLGKLVASLRVGPAGTPENEDGLSAVVWAE